MSCKIQIIVPGDGTLVVPIWRALEAQAALTVAVHGHTEGSAVLEFAAQQFRKAFRPELLGPIGNTSYWPDIWNKRGDL